MNHTHRMDAPVVLPHDPNRIFKLECGPERGVWHTLSKRLGPSLEKMLCIDRVNHTYEVNKDIHGVREFCDAVLDTLNIRYRLRESDLARIPKTGPVVVVANHPFGGIEGIILSSLLLSIRPDAKVMANFLLSAIPNMRDLFFFVDPFERTGSAAANLKPLRQAMRWLDGGGALGVFPAGTVSYLHLKKREIADGLWARNVGRIVRRAKCPVVPIYFEGANSPAFQVMGLVHPTVRTALLPREIFNKRGRSFGLRVGTPVHYRKIESLAGDEEVTEFLRQRVYMLRHRHDEAPTLVQNQNKPTPLSLKSIVEPTEPALLTQEIANLPPGSLLVDGDETRVYSAVADQIPSVLREIGRLREITFRATGEGTGNAIDLDDFDAYYLHLFIWNRKKEQIVGAYRLGLTDQILSRYGKGGFYTHTLFAYRTKLLRELGPAVELGRSFVREEYQRSFQPLLQLWKGIGSFCVAHPEYRTLFGPVSIANTYQSVSRQLMVQFLRINHGLRDKARLVKARNPLRIKRIAGFEADTVRMLLKDGDDVSELVSEVEPDQKGIPVLMRQYLKLGAKMLAFNVDNAFSDVVDALMVVDLTRTDRKLLERYMGKEGCASFLAYPEAATASQQSAR